MKGIINIGNSCFISSLLQVLFQIISPNMATIFLKLNHTISQSYTSTSNLEKARSELLIEFLNLYNNKNSDNGSQILIPTKFVTKLQKLAKLKNNEEFAAIQQNDVNEFFIFIIDSFHEIFKRANNETNFYNKLSNHKSINIEMLKYIQTKYLKDYSEIYELFGGIQMTLIKSVTTISAQNIDNKNQFINPLLNVNPELFILLDIFIPPNAETLIECLNNYIKEEILEEENAWFNEKTNRKERVLKQSAFWSFPNILVINLKRANFINNKNRQYINYPVDNLDLSVYALDKKNKYVYNLVGVCNHHGHSGVSGHYTSFVKENSSNKWYNCNDINISEINESQLITPNACMLFYMKK